MATTPPTNPDSNSQQVTSAREQYQHKFSVPDHVVPKNRPPPPWTIRHLEPPDAIHRPSNTGASSSSSTDLDRAAMPPPLPPSPYDLGEIASLDIYRARWEVDWGIVAEEYVGDWAIVKWVTSSNPVYSADEIVELATEILNFREADYGEQVDDEALMMRILETILAVYKPEDRVRATLEHGGVRNRILSILDHQDTLEWMGSEDEDEDVDDEGYVGGSDEDEDEGEKAKDCLTPSSVSNDPAGIQGAHDLDTPMSDAPSWTAANRDGGCLRADNPNTGNSAPGYIK